MQQIMEIPKKWPKLWHPALKAFSDTQVVLKTAEEVTATDMEESDGIIVGTPVHMGAPDWRIKQFIDNICGGLWMQDKLVGKNRCRIHFGKRFLGVPAPAANWP